MLESSTCKARKEGSDMKTSGIFAFFGFLALCAECEDLNLFLLSKIVGFALFLCAYIAYNTTKRDNQPNTLTNQNKKENESI